MNAELSPREIGQRLAQLRKYKGLSQEDLASRIPISRSSLAQIELGKRNLSVVEFQRLSHILEFSLDRFLSQNLVIGLELTEIEPEKNTKERISVPLLHVQKFKNILLYLLEKCAGKPNVGETVLYKLLYFSDFNYYELYEEHLTGAKYHKLPYGPVPQNLDAIIHKMIQEGNLKRVKTDYHGYPQTRYLPLAKADLTRIKASETDVIDKVIEQFSDWSAKAISEYSHKDIPWMASKEGGEINYKLAFYREAPFSVRNYSD